MNITSAPDFIGVGVQKSGTTWLAARLREHPQILLDEKEISFFSKRFFRGYDWYHRHFEGKGDRLAGEISPNYLITPRPDSNHLEHYPRWSLQSWWKHLIRAHPAARDEIRKQYPNIKVFAVFRNPADRAWSHYCMWEERRQKTCKPHLIESFEKMFRDNGRWMRLTGEYGSLLRYWREAFPDFGVFLFDDLVADSASFIASVYRFLGVDDGFAPDLRRRENARSHAPLDDANRRMVLEYYQDDIRDFESQIGRELPWLDPIRH